MRPSGLLIAVAIVLLIFFFDIMILWILKRIGGTLKADVKATIKSFGGNLAVASAGLIGSFLAIAILAFLAIYFIAGLISP
jgi:hypothetical protein